MMSVILLIESQVIADALAVFIIKKFIAIVTENSVKRITHNPFIIVRISGFFSIIVNIAIVLTSIKIIFEI